MKYYCLSSSHTAMKKRALILFFPFAAFLVETASFMPAMQQACSKAVAKTTTCGTQVKKPSTCCKKATTPAPCSKTKHSNKPVGNGSTDNPCCYNCPVCYTFLFEPTYEITALSWLIKKGYQGLEVSFRSTYQAEVWNPPDMQA